MPKKNGKDVYEEIRFLHPHVKVIFLSGYSEDVFSREGIQEKEVTFIAKPVLPYSLLKRIRKVLDA
ncbi:MAG TPA: response regulator [Dehalococcoidia bacterium]|nr:response regulator [Dehalococcoidia bacterium]